jgi:DNA-binding NarL/FixJ family response regulator
VKSARSKSARPPAAPVPAAGARRSILIVDDHPFMRAGLAGLIDRQPDLRVAAEVGDVNSALAALARPGIDLVLTDITMPGRSGLDFIKDVVALHPKLPLLVLSMHDEALYAERVLRAGARGYLMKESGGENLLAAIRQVLAGQVYVSPAMSARVLESLTARQPRGSNSPIARLTDREFEVFQLIGAGKGTREIAQQLHLSSKTVDVHRGRLKEKLGCADGTALVRHAVRWVETQQLPD